MATALVVASCSSAADSVAATVNGEDILISDVTELRDTYDDESVLASDFRDDLSRLIFSTIVGQELGNEFGITVDETEVDARISEFNEAIATNGITRAEALGIPGATEALLRREARVFEMQTLGTAALAGSPEQVADILTNDPELVTEVCVRHILVATQPEAEDVTDRLSQGEEFADVATEVSIDAGTPGGDLGCAMASRYVPEFAQASMVAPLGSAFGPVETDFGFHILIVDGRTAPTAEDVKADPLTYVSAELASSLWTEWFNVKIDQASVSVASEIGTWSSDADGIVPPAGG